LGSRPSDEPWRLKVLSGPHLGAEVLLTGKQYLIGSDEDCDIVLSDASVYQRHVRLEKSSGEWTITVLEGAVLVGDEPLSPGSTGRLEAGKTFALGTTHIGMGPLDYDWAGKVLPSAVMVDKVPADNREPEKELAAQSALERKGARRFSSVSRNTLRSLFWVVGGAGGILWVLLLMLGLDRGAAALPPVSERQQIERVLQNFPLRRVTVSRSAEGWRIRGYCNTEQERAHLQEGLDRLSFPVSVQVLSRQGLLNAVNTVIGSFAGTGVHATLLDDGKIRLDGSLSSPGQKGELLRLLHDDVPGIREMEDRIRIVQERPEAAGAIQSGRREEESSQEMTEVRQPRIRGIVLWKSGGLVILDDWVSLPLGAQVKGKWHISRIESDRVWLRNGSRKMVRYIGEIL